MPQLQGLSHCGPHTPGAHAVRRGGGRGSPRGSTCSPQSTRLCPLSPRTPAGGLWPKPCTPYLAKAAGCSGVLVGDRPGSQAPRAGAEGVPGPATHRWSSRHLARLAHTGTGRAPRSGRGHTPGHKALGQRGRGDEAPARLTPHRLHPPRPAPAPSPTRDRRAHEPLTGLRGHCVPRDYKAEGPGGGRAGEHPVPACAGEAGAGLTDTDAAAALEEALAAAQAPSVVRLHHLAVHGLVDHPGEAGGALSVPDTAAPGRPGGRGARPTPPTP